MDVGCSNIAWHGCNDQLLICTVTEISIGKEIEERGNKGLPEVGE